MKGPAKSGAFIYAEDIKKLSDFYSTFLGMTLVRETKDLIVLSTEGLQLIVHVFPDDLSICNAPEFEKRNTIKLFFSVDSISNSRDKAKELGGLVYEKVWKNPIFSVCNAKDPEGNSFQIREFA